jgi:hypothetical protein
VQTYYIETQTPSLSFDASVLIDVSSVYLHHLCGEDRMLTITWFLSKSLKLVNFDMLSVDAPVHFFEWYFIDTGKFYLFHTKTVEF